MTLAPRIERLARQFKALVTAACHEHLLEVRVFGSQARGDATTESDLDLFVLLDRPDRASVRAIVDAACQVAEEVDYRPCLSPIVMDVAHFEDLRRREWRLARDIVDEGIVI